MKSRHLILSLCALAIAAIAIVSTMAPAADRAKKATSSAETKAAPAVAAATAEMIRLATPGEAHAKLKGIEGKWKTVQKSWFAPGEPTVSEGTCENKLILGGRFLEQRYMATVQGQPFEGYGLTGYDNKKGEYTMVWIDNMSTAVMTGTGSMDASDLTMNSPGEGPDGKPTVFKLVTHMTDANRHVFSMYASVDGKEQLMMEIAYTRM